MSRNGLGLTVFIYFDVVLGFIKLMYLNLLKPQCLIIIMLRLFKNTNFSEIPENKMK